jgi:hypothetical protein
MVHQGRNANNKRVNDDANMATMGKILIWNMREARPSPITYQWESSSVDFDPWRNYYYY